MIEVSRLSITAGRVKELAHACGFELAGITAALPSEDFERFQDWREAGMAGEMAYLTDQRGDARSDPRNLLPEAQSIVCLGKLYNTAHPHSTDIVDSRNGWISRYAWGADYHDVMRASLNELVARIKQENGDFVWKICVDTAPLLERSYARQAGLGWIGKNTCLINQQRGSWFFLAELLISIPFSLDSAPPDRCGTCTRCIDACPTNAILTDSRGNWIIDSRLCISYLTIETRGRLVATEETETALSNHIFGCDICQDVCPWNRKAPVNADELFSPVHNSPKLAELAELTRDDFHRLFRKSAIFRAKYEGFLRNVAVALGNSGDVAMREPLELLSAHESEVISTTARKALNRLLQTLALFLVLLFVTQIRAFSNAITLAEFTADEGFNHFYNNEFDEALAVFEAQLRAHPTDPEMYNHVAQAILYREMLRDGALESQLVSGNNPFLRRAKMDIPPQDKQRFSACVTQSLRLSQAELQRNPHSTNALAALAVAHGLRANYLFLVEKAWMDSLHEATAARKADEKILEIDSKDVDANLILGLNEYVVGSLPFYMRALGFLGGFHGDRLNGIRKLEFVAKNGIRNHYDAEVLLAVIYRREKNPQRAIPLLKDLAGAFPRNYLFRFEQVQMYSDFGDKQSALEVLNEIETLRSRGAVGYADLKTEKLRYLKGNLLFWYGDLNPALADLKRATQNAEELDLNTAVLAWLRLGQVYDLQGNHPDAISAYKETVKTAPKSEAASEARGYIVNPYRRRQKDNS